MSNLIEDEEVRVNESIIVLTHAEAVLMKRIKEMRDGKPKYAASDRLQEIRSALKLIKSYENGASLGELIGQ
jgi:hypothetical protein